MAAVSMKKTNISGKAGGYRKVSNSKKTSPVKNTVKTAVKKNYKSMRSSAD
jgi:hypothetical protein